MAIVDDDDFDGSGRILPPGRAGWLMNAAGAITSVALVLGVMVWGYKLAVRDVSGIPVVRALDGPMRIAPQEPGGEIASHVGLSVNEVAAEGFAAPLPDQMVLAPRPVDLSDEDQPMLAGAPPAAPEATTLAALSATDLPDTLVSPSPVEQLTETPLVPADVAPDGTAEAADEPSGALETAVESAVAEALGTDVVAQVPSSGAVLRSPRPERRPEGDASAEAVIVPASVDAASAAPASAAEVDVATLTVGTRLVQLGAFDDEAGARTEWASLQKRFGDLIASKALVLQKAESGGRSFVRLRALGFEDEADARRFCSALLAENASCIPVAHRP
jgi:hypothetical protein